jgi:hypothetical protein
MFFVTFGIWIEEVLKNNLDFMIFGNDIEMFDNTNTI